ncbi:MAG TPA: VTT domain-containing protein [Blastocatellia bacterium]|nr:VTT domain-containing protein [Blastocatellia bacterium]
MDFLFAFIIEVWTLLKKLGGIGQILMGLLDSSVIPTPGGLDALTIILATSEPGSWLYYAVMAVIGSVLGGYLTYRLGRKGGEEALEQRLSKKRIERVHKAFERWGFGTIFLPAILPPPVPIGPFLLGAGAMNYPLKKYLTALAAGRAIRFTLVAYLASRFGRRVLNFFAENHTTILVAFIIVIVLGAAGGIIYYVRRRRARKDAPEASPGGD